MGSYGDGIGSRSVTHRRSSQNPYTVFSPTFQFINHETSPVSDFNDRCLTVRSSCLYHLQLVIYDVSGTPFRRWRFPIDSDRCWTYRLSRNVAWRCPRYYSGVSALQLKKAASSHTLYTVVFCLLVDIKIKSLFFSN